MARSSIRPMVLADTPAVGELMIEVGLRPNADPAQMHWKYFHPRTDWPGPRSFVMVRGNEILAHAGAIPGACLTATQRVRTIHVIDWAARSTATGAGVSLMKYIGQHTEALLAIGGSAQTLQLLPHLGYRCLGNATCYVRPLHPSRILTPSAHPLSTLLPRFARSALWTAQAPSVDTDGWDVCRVEPAELERLRSVFPSPSPDTALLERSEEMLRYALACPIASMELYALERAGRTRGYFLLSFALRQARLADWWMESDDPGDWRALVQCAVHQARRNVHAAELTAWGSNDWLSKRLHECGFHARDELPVQVLAPRNPELAACALRVQMLDNDAAYRHGGINEFLA